MILRKDSNIAFGILYQQYFGYTQKFILNNKGNLEDAEDIFRDALLILYENSMLMTSKSKPVWEIILSEL